MRTLPAPGPQRDIRVIMLLAVLGLWVPCALLTLTEGREHFRSFLLDTAIQSRVLIVIPLLIVGAKPLNRRLSEIAGQFLTAKIVEESGREVLQQEQRALDQAKTTSITWILLWAFSFALVFVTLWATEGSTLYLPWYHRPGSTSLSAAGWWYAIAVLPCIEILLMRFLLKQWRWMKLLYRVSRLKLRLIATHPDKVGGLGFLEWSEWEWLPFCLAMGTLFAGEIANRIIHAHAHLSDFKYIAAIPVIVVLIICICPLFVFYGPLLRTKRAAVFSHGRLGLTIGRIFEDKWLSDSIHWNQSALSSHDVPGAKYFANIVENVYKMKLLPIGAPMVLRLVVCTLLPMVPVLLVALPFDMLMHQLLKVLL